MNEMTNAITLSVIIPAYNEEKRLPSYLCEIFSYLRKNGSSFEVIVVDDGSQDATVAAVERLLDTYPQLRLIRLPENRGKGFAVKTGMMNATGKLRLFTDADGATPITELDRLKNAINLGADVAIASRAIQDDTCTVHARLHRKIIGSIFNNIVRMMAVKGISDTQCGFKLFTENSASSVFPLQTISDFGFDVEILFISQRKGYLIFEVPVNWNDVEKSKVNLIWDSFKMFIDIFMVRINNLRGCYH